ncbi:MAG: PAS domain S-box protein [Anaerolineales bacterium]|nr:PAS domain S-box protein [Anaerolineales bacterium]
MEPKKSSQKKRLGKSSSGEQVFRLMFENHSAVMLLIEPQTGLILDANPAATVFYGYPKSQLCGMVISQINILPAAQVEAERQKAFKEERNYFIFTHRLANGDKRIVEVHSSPIPLQERQVLFSIIHDITVRKQAEDVMRMGEVKYKAIFENAPIGIFQSTLEGRFQSANPFLAQIYGYDSPEDLIASITNISQQIYVNASERLEFQRILAEQGEVTEFIGENYRKDGTIIWTQTTARAEKDECGNILYYEGFITDVTARKKAEQALQNARDELEQRVKERTEELTQVNGDLRREIGERRQAELELRDSEEKFRSIVEYATNGISLTDEYGMVVEWNPAQENILERTRAEVINRPLWDVQFQSMQPHRRIPEVHKKLTEIFQQMLTTGEVPEHVRDQEITIQTTTGAKRIIRSFVFSIKTANGFRLAGISWDITERRQAQMAQQESLERLQKIASRVPGVVYQYRLRPDGSSCFPFASGAIHEIYRVSPQEVMEDASKVFERIHPDDLDGVAASIHKSAKELTPWKYEYRVKFEDGVIRHLYGNSAPQLEEDGSVLWHGFIADITDRKMLENELQAQRDFATQIINAMGQGLTVTNAEGQFEFVNPAYAHLFGYDTAELIGKYPRDLTVVEDHTTLAEQRHKRRNGETSTYESQIRRIDGSVAQVLITGVPRESNGKFNGAIAVITDLTERKKMEETLRESERFPVRSWTPSPPKIAILDENGLIVAINRAWREMAQNNLEEPALVCEGTNYLGVCDATSGPEGTTAALVAKGIRAVIYGELPSFSIEYSCDTRLNNYWYNLQVTRFVGSGPIRVVVAHEDITARRQAEKRVQKQNGYLSALHQITLDLLDHREMDELFQAIVDRAAVLLDAPFAELMLEEDGELVVQVFTKNQFFQKGERVGRDSAIISWQAFDTKRPVILDEYSAHPHHHKFSYETPIHALAEFPVLVRDKSIGVLALGRSEAGYIFSEEQIKSGVAFAQLAALVLDNAQLLSAAEHEIGERRKAESELRQARDQLVNLHTELEKSYVLEQRLARIDSLTGINNRRSLLESAERELQIAIRYQQPFAIMLFDVDRFKNINDTFGHLSGDQVLMQIAQTTNDELRSMDVIGRYGGDEFIVLLPQTNSMDAYALAERIHASISEIQMGSGNNLIELAISIGITQVQLPTASTSGSLDERVDSVERMILRADQALYVAKQTRDSRTIIIDPE